MTMMASRSPLDAIRHRLRSQAGYSLVELVIACVVLAVVMAGIMGIWLGLQRTYAYEGDDAKAQREARAALGEMVEFIRTAREPQGSVADDLRMVITAADANSLTCWTDIDRDANHDLELVRFRVDTSTRTLYRDTSDSGDPAFTDATSTRLVGNWLSNDSTTPLFQYSDSNDTPLSVPVTYPMEISTVKIDLRIDVYTEFRPIAHQLESVVQPRNLRQY
jgi:Tfp pilus assembly protein PilV